MTETTEIQLAIARQIVAGKSLTEVAASHGRSFSWVRRQLDQLYRTQGLAGLNDLPAWLARRERPDLPTEPTWPLPGLNGHPEEIARLVAQGLTNKGIAYRLGLTTAGVQSHINRAKARLGLRSRMALASWVWEQAPPANLSKAA